MHDLNSSLDLVTRAILQGIQEASEGIPISFGKMSATCMPDLSEKEIIATILLLDATPQRMNVAVRFIKGDIWNTVPDIHGAKKQFMRTAYPDADAKTIDRVYNDWKHCARIAKRWRADRRQPKWAWAFYRKHYPGRNGVHIAKEEYGVYPRLGVQVDPNEAQTALRFDIGARSENPDMVVSSVGNVLTVTAKKAGTSQIIITAQEKPNPNREEYKDEFAGGKM